MTSSGWNGGEIKGKGRKKQENDKRKRRERKKNEKRGRETSQEARENARNSEKSKTNNTKGRGKSYGVIFMLFYISKILKKGMEVDANQSSKRWCRYVRKKSVAVMATHRTGLHMLRKKEKRARAVTGGVELESSDTETMHAKVINQNTAATSGAPLCICSRLPNAIPGTDRTSV